MSFEIKVPAAGESVTEATIAEWLKSDGDYVERNDVLLVLETDKASMELVAEESGQLSIRSQEGEDVKVGSVIGVIDTSAKKQSSNATASTKTAGAATGSVKPAAAGGATGATTSASSTNHPAQSPAVRKALAETGVNPNSVSGSGKAGRLTKFDVLQAAESGAQHSPPAAASASHSNGGGNGALSAKMEMRSPSSRSVQNEETREPMSRLRKTIAARLVQSQQTAAILTTFNEIDMSEVMSLRTKYKDSFKEKYGVGLGFMGFFVKATVAALKAFPKVNASIDGNDIVYRNFSNIGIAVGGPKGLIVPVVRNAELLSLAEIELAIKEFALKAREGKIDMDDLAGGTFTISNGGTYGSLMSTPIINPPQTGILGMHKIEDRPIALNGQVVIRPMMYVALSYDHRIIDGSESVQFLVKIKEGIEDPSRLLLEI